MTSSDIGLIIVFIGLIVLFLTSLKPIPYLEKPLLHIDYETSQAMKGIACIMILLTHFGNFSAIDHGIIRITKLFSANIALTLFMFFSGYGMSLKNIKMGGVKKEYKKSLKKIYLPCLFVNTIAFVLYFILPDITLEEVQEVQVNKNLFLIQNIDTTNILPLLLSFLSGNGSWYVLCIIVFYSLYYIASYISEKKKINVSLVLFLLFFIYFIIAYMYFGKSQAHYFRYCWTFLLGHAIATRTNISMLLAICSLISLGTENWCLHMSYIMAIIILCIVSFINSRYSIKGKFLLYLGAISYFYYLSHETISRVILAYFNIQDNVLIWVTTSGIIAAILYHSYNKLTKYK